MHQFRDPIHGFIDVSPDEKKIIDSAPFQRLRHIKQLATTYLVYHGAEHTRFGHSLGVMHLVTKAYESALANYKDLHGQELFDEPEKKWYRQILRLIALTHDLGHAPFSHASEALFEDGLGHEDFTKKILCETEIAEYIKSIGRNFCKANGLSDKYNITPELIWLIYGEKNPELDPRYIMPDFKFLKGFMDSELDCDKMDYLLRDSHYCGVNYGRYDMNRLLSSLNVYKDETCSIMQLAINHSGIHALEEFIIARYFMFIQVYFHKTRRFLDNLLIKSIADILPNRRYPLDINSYLELDDSAILHRIKENYETSSHAKKFVDRSIMTCAYDTGTHSDSKDNQTYAFVLRELRNNLDCELFEDHPYKPAHKIHDIPFYEMYNDESSKGIPIIKTHLKHPADILSESVLLKSLKDKPINVKRIYVEKCYEEAAKDIVKKFMNTEGESDG